MTVLFLWLISQSWILIDKIGYGNDMPWFWVFWPTYVLILCLALAFDAD